VPDWALPPDLSSLLIFGWLWHDGRSIDENLMDLAYMLARNSTCKDGHMGCLMVRGVCAGRGGERGSPEALGIAGAVPVTPTAPPSCAPAPGDPVRPSVVVTAINAPMFGAHRSDVHAEALAVSECARRGIATAGLSCYVTRAPCLSCYKILATAGVRRIVCPQSALPSDDCATSAGYYGIEYVWVPDRPERAEERNARAAANTDYARVRELREERKRQRREGKNANSGRKAACAGHEAGAEGASSAGGGQEGES
jgi:dCMP deaminase